ncbi:MarR family winged helix-turn-helix transcriptional regulator [Subtercola boreus]|nr:MarR family winged helix-turn-helix transcriptional regulator [Subtercola boreus]
MSAPGVTDFTGYLFRRAQQHHVAAWQRDVSDSITSVQFGVLNTLQASPGASQRELCDRLDLDRSTIADIVGRLQQNNLVIRNRDADDRRKNVLHLSETGREVWQTLLPRVTRMNDRLTAPLGADDTLKLRELLDRVLSASPPTHELPGH